MPCPCIWFAHSYQMIERYSVDPFQRLFKNHFHVTQAYQNFKPCGRYLLLYWFCIFAQGYVWGAPWCFFNEAYNIPENRDCTDACAKQFTFPMKNQFCSGLPCRSAHGHKGESDCLCKVQLAQREPTLAQLEAGPHIIKWIFSSHWTLALAGDR